MIGGGGGGSWTNGSCSVMLLLFVLLVGVGLVVDWMTGVYEPLIKLFLVTSPILLEMNEVVAWKCFFVYPNLWLKIKKKRRFLC